MNICMSYMGPVYELNGHQKSTYPVFTAGENSLSMFKVE